MLAGSLVRLPRQLAGNAKLAFGARCAMSTASSASSRTNSDYSHRLLERRLRVTSPNLALLYKDDPLTIVYGKDCYLFDENGNSYLDCVNNVAHVGHANPEIARAMGEEAMRLMTNSRYLHPMRYEYMERLLQHFPKELNTVFMVCSGSEANELALRIAMEATGHTDVITLDGAYHGHTRTLVDVSPYKYKQSVEYKRDPKHYKTKNYVHEVPCPDTYRGKYRNPETAGTRYAETVRKAIAKANSKKNRGVAAFIHESIVGCGGQIVPPDGYLQQVYEAVREAGGVCIADEVQCGFGRVGEAFWGFETHGVVPDIVTIGKPMGNGFPVAGVIVRRELAERFSATGMEYFNTTGGNSVACVVANTVLNIIERDNLQQRGLEMGSYLINKFNEMKARHKSIGDVRGQGLFLGVELVADRKLRIPDGLLAKEVCKRARYKGVLLSKDGPDENVIKIKPPMTFTEQDAQLLLTTFEESLIEASR